MKKNTKFKIRMAAAFSMGAVTALSFNAFYTVKNVVAEEMSTEHVIKESNYTLAVENYDDTFSVESTGIDSFDSETDWDWSYQTSHTVSAFAKGPKGYYVRLGDFVYYCDFETQTLIALCNRPDCLHDKETDSEKRSECTAYVAYGSVNDGLQYYDGKLYANTSSVYFDTERDADYREKEYLLELAPDGSSREQMDYQMENAYSFAFHRGSLYYISRETNPETLIGTETVNRLELGKKEPETIATLSSMDAVLRVYPYGDLVYIQTKLADTEESSLIIYDTKTSKAQVKKANWQSMFLPTENDTFLQCTLKEDGLYAENVNAMLESTTESKLLTMDSLKNLGFDANTTGDLYSWISTDDTHLYVYGMTEIDPIVAAFNKESGELEAAAALPGMPLFQCIGVDDEYLFYQCAELDGGTDSVYWVKKSDFLENGATFNCMEP